MNILLPTLGSSGWMAGVNYLINLCRAVELVDPDTAVYHLGKIDATLYGDKIRFAGEIIEKRPARFSTGWIINEVIHKRFGLPVEWGSAYEGELEKIDVGFQTDSPGLGKRFPILYWIPDFQHLHYPQFFTEEQILHRKQGYPALAQKASLVILSSNDAKNDFCTLFPEFADKARVLQFASHIPEQLILSDETFVVGKYNIPDRYFFLPNQFWQHKNHRIVFDAVRRLKEQNILVNVVMTGHTYDYRTPDYFNQLLTYCAEIGISRQLYFLGLVPFEDMVDLVKPAVSVINPSLFEGWSTTVEEVKSIGQRIILSDIKVHREQAPDHGIYFDVNSSDQLAEIMKNLWLVSAPLEIDRKRLSIDNKERQLAYGRKFLEYCTEAIENFGK